MCNAGSWAPMMHSASFESSDWGPTAVSFVKNEAALSGYVFWSQNTPIFNYEMICIYTVLRDFHKKCDNLECKTFLFINIYLFDSLSFVRTEVTNWLTEAWFSEVRIHLQCLEKTIHSTFSFYWIRLHASGVLKISLRNSRSSSQLRC